MKAAAKFATGWLLVSGFMSIAIAVSAVLEPPKKDKNLVSFLLEEIFQEQQTQENQDAATGALMFGIPSLLLGGWLAGAIYRQGKKEERDRLDSIFYQLLKEGNGQVTLLRFAMDTQLPVAAAKLFLDGRAREFNATFNVSEHGGIAYQFHELSLAVPTLTTSTGLLPLSTSAPTDASKYWTIGSPKDEVLKIQGTPTKVQKSARPGEEIFYYGQSAVTLVENLVAEYDNRGKNLKVNLI